MPMSRYQIRNEYALADSELYTAGDRDDPEALLEAVAMAGLVGVLRQLGDLAEFAAEIFHDLHEEVMVTAARGHGLMARVQQLEAEFPLIEKAFLSQTNHSSFFSSAGVDWHPNLCTKQNLITGGDMPRFVMDSYEECRGPPRLFLLDKFDVAGAGACLKRYTDPSFFKTEPLSSKIETVDITREKKNRKVKKKGSRWKNGETPEVAPPSHAKLHQLFLEERIENGHSDPARVVRLKRRQLNGFPFDLKPEKSYMEKFLETSSPEHKAICDVSVISSALKLTYDNSIESGPEILEINTLSPVKMPSQGKESCCSSPDAQKVVVNPFAGELNGETIGRAIMRVPDPVADGETDESSTVHKMEIGKELLIDADGKTEVSVDGEHSDSVASEVENYMDALTNMESEMETDYEPKTKQHQSPSNVGKYGTDSEADDEQLDDRTNFSDSPSVGVSSLSDDVNSLLKKGRSNFSCSDYSRLHDEGADEVFPSAENSLVKIVSDQLSHQSAFVDTLGMDSSEIVVSSDFCTDKSKIPDLEEASCSPQLTDLNMLLPSAAAAASSLIVSVGPDSNDTPSHSIEHHFNSPGSNDGGTYTADCSVALSDVSQTRQETPCPVSSQTNPLAELDHEDPNILLDANVHWANVLEMASEKQGSELVNEVLQTDYSDETSFWNLAEEEFGSSGLIAPSAEEQFTFSALPGLELDSGAILLPKNSESKLPNAIDSEVSDARTDLLPVDLDLAEVAVPSSDENLKLEELSKEKYGENLGGFTIKVDAVGRDALLFEHPSDGSDKPSCVDLVNWDDVATKTGKAEDVALSSGTGAGGTNDDNANGTGCPSSDVDDSPCAKITDIRESLLISEDSCQKQLDLNQTFSPGLLTELEVQKGVEQPDPSPTYYDSSPLMVESSDHDNQEVIDHAHDLFLMGQTSNSLAASDVTKPKSSECSNRELESKSTCYTDFVEEDTNPIISPTCSLSEASSLEQQAPELPPYQANAECVHAVADEANSKSLNLPASPKGYIEELRSPLEHLSQSPAYQLDSVCVQENEPSSFPSDVQLEQMQTADNLNSERSLDASSLSFLEGVPSRGILAKSISQQLDGFKVVRKTVDSVFPSLSPLPKAAHADLEDLPPLPPLPPMQWRLGKVLSAQLTLDRQQVPVIQGTVSPMPLLTSKENSELEILSPGGLIWRPSSPSLPISAAESQRPQHNISEESTGHSLQQALPCSETVSSHNEATSHQDCISLEGTQSLSPLLNLLDTTSKKPEHDFTSLKGDFIQFSSDMPFQVPSLEQTTSGRDPAVVVVPLIDPLSHLESGTVVETRLTSEILEGEQGNFPNKSMKPVSLLEEQSQCDVVASQGERTLPPNTLSLPANYLVGKPNGNKFPRPRNPLIDAVAAHDKTKLRKVTERVRHQIEPKVDGRFALQLRKVTERVRHQIEPKDDERDSLLEQIRTKSFNLKRAAVTRPTIQAVQGPQTNLNVAAILEKANAIRQALTGSDEDDESDSWSDN